MTAAASREEWRAAWPLPFVGMLGNSGASIFVYSNGIFMAAVTADLGWTRTQFSAGLTFSMLLTLFAVPAVGVLIDRLGPRRIAFIGLPVFVAALASLGLTTGTLWQWWLHCVVYSLLATFISPVVWAAAVADRFDAARGLALAITLAGTGLAAAISPLLATLYVDALGWRLAYGALALTWAVPMLPLLYFFFFAARDVQPAARRTAPARLPFAAYRDAIATRPFMTLLIAGCLFAFVMLALMINLTPILHGNGIPPTKAAAIAGLAGLFAIVGRIGAGFLIDRYSARAFGTIAFTLPIGTCALLLYGGDSVALAIVAAVLMGLAMGAELDIVSYLITRYYGMRSFGGLYGVLLGTMGVTAGTGPTIAAWMVDKAGGYDSLLQWIVPLFVAGTMLIASLPKPPPHIGAAVPA